jgi:hypothetical protein
LASSDPEEAARGEGAGLLTSGSIFTGLEDAALALHAIVAGLGKAAEIPQAEAEGAEPKAIRAGREQLAWPAAPVDAPALLDVQGRARALLLPRLAAHGFELETPTPRSKMVRTLLRRSTPLGRQCIEIAWTGDAASHYDATMVCSIEPALPGPVAKLCGAQSIVVLRILDTPQLNGFLNGFVPEQPTSREYRASGSARLDALLSALADWLIQELLPVLDHCRTLAGFLAHERVEPQHPISVKPYLANLALAYCAGVPDLDDRFDQLMQRRRQARINPGQMAQAYEALRTQAAAFFGSIKEASA